MLLRSKWLFFFVFTVLSITIQAQNEPSLYGTFQSNANFFLRDSSIGAYNTPQYDNQLFGAEAWLNLTFKWKNIKVGARYDLFNNSNLLNPTDSYTDQGIGMYFAEIKLDKLDLRVGHIYDQIGSGLIFRAYEVRPLLIDNALFGVHGSYKLTENLSIKAFTGRQRQLFENYNAVLKGGAIDGFFTLGNNSKTMTFNPSFGLLARTNSEETTDKLLSILRNYTGEDRITNLSLNTYSFTIYNALHFGDFDWYFEGAFKSKDVLWDPYSFQTKLNGEQVLGKFVEANGSVIFTTLSYSTRKIGLTLEYKRTENFDFRTDQTLSLNRGVINFLPPMTRQNTYRLTSRYAPATQAAAENAVQIEVRSRLSKRLSMLNHISVINDLQGEKLYREIYTHWLYKFKSKWRLTSGIQFQTYNQAIYEGKPSEITPMIRTITPFFDFLYRFSRKNSIRVEGQYMHTQQDYGSWLYALIEVGLAPHWQFEVSGMYNIVPNTNNFNVSQELRGKSIFYPTLGAVYSHNQKRFSLRYVKQVAGIVCSGGVCRLEPAFSGIKFDINSTF